MEGGSIIRPPCAAAGIMGVTRPPLHPASASLRPIRPAPFTSSVPSASCPPIHALPTPESSLSLSTPYLSDEDPFPAEEKEKTENREEKIIGISTRSIFGSSPSMEEAETAVSDLQRICLPTTFSQFVGDEAPSFTEDAFGQTPSLHATMKRASSSKLSINHCKPGEQVHKSSAVLSQAPRSVLDALGLMHFNPSVKRMVVSLSSDKAVWNAIMKNEMVQEFKKQYHADKFLQYAAGGSTTRSSDGSPDIISQILSWLFENFKAKVMEFIDDISRLVNKLILQEENENTMDIVSDVVRSSFMLSILVFIVVILKRAA